MKTFLSFISENAAKEKDDGFFIDKDGYAVPSAPITIRKPKKNKKKAINEFTINDLPGQHKFDDYTPASNKHEGDISKKLHRAQVKPTAAQKRHLDHYTGDDYGTSGSEHISKALIQNHRKSKPPTKGMSDEHKKIHETISKLASNPLGHDVHLYSGVGFDPKKAAKKSKKGIIHLPAHISTSHSTNIASSFADEKPGRHIMHIDAKAHDKGYHIGKYSAMDHEHETVIPAGTKLKYSHSSKHKSVGHKYQVHHFTIHSQD